ncbi:hypothetical protein B1H10_01565, partial [candidate division KSB1 bacterium 4484_188]
GFDTGLATSRIKIFEELPNAGIPYTFENWEKYSELVHHLIQTNSIDTVRDIWWDIRPHPIFGTIEVRVCDAMPTLKENIAVSTLIYLLVLKISQEFERKNKLPQLDRWILEQNKWRAARHGINGEIIVNQEGETRSIKQQIKALHQELLDFTDNTDLKYSQKYLNFIPEILEKRPSYQRQREWIRQRPGDYKFVVDNLLKETRENLLLNGY